MDIEQIKAQREKWYSPTYVRLELCKELAYRELAFLEKLPPEITDRRARVVRCAQGYRLELLESNFNAFRFMQLPYMNLYYSLAHYDKIPQFSFSPPTRSKQYQAWSNEGEYARRQVAFDWGVDIDNKNLEEAHRDASRVKKLFDSYQLPYHLTYSGSKGFHLVIDHRWLPQIEVTQLIKMLAELTAMIKVVDNIPSIDDTIIDSRRILKLPYSYVFSNPNTGRICLPLDDKQFESFWLDLVDPEYVMHNIKVMNRGLLTCHADQSEEQARASFTKMAKNFIDVDKYLNQWVAKGGTARVFLSPPVASISEPHRKNPPEPVTVRGWRGAI